MSETVDIICLGEPMAEFVRADIPGIGEVYRPGVGGDTSNTAIAAARQGARTGFLTALGDDEFGDGIRALWSAEGVDHSNVARDPDAPTGIYFVHPHASERHFLYYRAHSAASRWPAASLPRDYIASARVLHVSAISQAISATARDTVTAAIDIARAAGVTVSYDTNLRLKLWSLEDAQRTIHAAMAKSDIAFPSIDDAMQLTGLEEPDRIVDFYFDLGARIVALKMGEAGALVATPESRQMIAPVPVEAVDSTGAGDAFAGGFLAYWLETGDPFEAGRRAAAVAAGTVAGYGAIAPIPRREAVMAMIGGEAGTVAQG